MVKKKLTLPEMVSIPNAIFDPTKLPTAEERPGFSSRRKRRPRCMHSQHQQRPMGALAASASTASAAATAAAASGAFAEELGVLDEEQASMMAEECILVDRNDRPTGRASKVGRTHLAVYDGGVKSSKLCS